MLSAIGMLVGLGLLAIAVTAIALNHFARDDDGYFSVSTGPLATTGYAITTENLDFGTDTKWATDGSFGSVHLAVESNGGQDLFVGVARADDLDTYLGKVDRSELFGVTDGNGSLHVHKGGAPKGKPADQDFWLAQSQGPEERDVELGLKGGTYAAVVMNADASRDVSTEVHIGVRLGWLAWAGFGVLAVALVILIPSFVIFIGSVRTPRTTQP